MHFDQDNVFDGGLPIVHPLNLKPRDLLVKEDDKGSMGTDSSWYLRKTQELSISI